MNCLLTALYPSITDFFTPFIMKITEHLAKSNKSLFSFELLPPLRGDTIERIYRCIDPLMEFKPAFISVTYHREEVIYKDRPDGLLERCVVRKRPGTVGISSAIQLKYKTDVVPHIICGGFTREETENALIDLNFIGINNVFAVRGDNLSGEPFFTPEPGGHSHPDELVRQIVDLNTGIYTDDQLENSTPTNFSIGVAAYPEKHIESPNMQTELRYLKKKVDAGADYIITQMFFDNEKFFRFVDLCRKEGIRVPIIPGLKPLSTQRQLTVIPQTFFVDIPQDLVLEIEKCTSPEEVRQVGAEWTIAQAKELLAAGVPGLHFFTKGVAGSIRKIAEAVF